MPFRAMTLVLLAAVVACAHRAPAAPAQPTALVDTAQPADSVVEYYGFYRWFFEHSEFVACGTPENDRPWWVVPTVVALRQRDSLAARVEPNAQGPVFVRVRGIAGPRLAMGAGHLGASSRYFRLLEVLEMRPADGATCPRRT